MVLEAAQISLSFQINQIAFWSSPLIHSVALKGHRFSLHYINFDLCEKNIMWLCIHNYLACIHNYLACMHNILHVNMIILHVNISCMYTLLSSMYTCIHNYVACIHKQVYMCKYLSGHVYIIRYINVADESAALLLSLMPICNKNKIALHNWYNRNDVMLILFEMLHIWSIMHTQRRCKFENTKHRCLGMTLHKCELHCSGRNWY